MKNKGLLAVDLPPNFFPFTNPGDSDWHDRYAEFNNPGEYHNGGIWPFICGFYVAALVAAKRFALAEQKLMVLTDCLKKTNESTESAAKNNGKSSNYINEENMEFGFNEWIKAQDGEPKGQNWQTWSAAMYLYAAKCVEERTTPFFEEMRK